MSGNPVTSVPTQSPPPYESTAPQSTETPPPDYQAAVAQTTSANSGGDTSSLAQSSSNEPPGRTVLTIDGKYIFSSTAPQEPIYSLTHPLDGHETNQTGILVTRIEQISLRAGGGTRWREKKRDVFALRHRSPQSYFSGYEIDGKRFLSGKSGYMSTRVGLKSGIGWSASGTGLPSFTLRPASSSSGAEGKRYEWRDNKSSKVVAMETRRKWDTSLNEQLTPPKLELKFQLEGVDKEYMDFLIATWCMHNWREAKDMTKEPLTWEECECRPWN